MKNQKTKNEERSWPENAFVSPDFFFFFPKKMDLEDRKQIEMLEEEIICLKASIIREKNTKQAADEKYKFEKGLLEQNLQNLQLELTNLKQKNEGQHVAEADKWFDEETKKELQRWKHLAPEEKIREHREKLGMLKDDEDWEPMTDIQVDRWIEEENEKEMERLEKLEAQKHN